MNRLLLSAFFALILSSGISQSITKNPAINDVVLTLTPLVFDPEMDSTISYIEFWQDTTTGVKYEEKTYAGVGSSEKIKYDHGKDWPVVGIGTVGDYRIDKDRISVIIQVHYQDGTSKSFTHREKLKKLTFWEDFEWANYSLDVEIYDEGEEDLIHSL